MLSIQHPPNHKPSSNLCWNNLCCSNVNILFELSELHSVDTDPCNEFVETDPWPSSPAVVSGLDTHSRWEVHATCRALEGAICQSDTSPGFNGWIPDCLNPLNIFSGVNELYQASRTSDAKAAVVITFPGLTIRYLWHAFEKLDLNEWKTPTSSGCKMCVVWAGRQSKCTLFFWANSIGGIEMCEVWPSWMGPVDGMLLKKNLKHSRNNLMFIHDMIVCVFPFSADVDVIE